nr:MAG TPA: hypothetical protein [Herelleviridae sp. ctUqP11]
MTSRSVMRNIPGYHYQYPGFYDDKTLIIHLNRGK